MKIIVYTISDCPFSKQEKEYLASHGLTFEEKNLETNKEFLTEMLAVSNNFAGTPVTKVEKDDGQITVLKGFTKEEFDQTLNIAPAVAPAVPVEAPQAASPKIEAVPPVVPQVETASVQAAESSINIPADVTEPKEPAVPAPVQSAPVVTPNNPVNPIADNPTPSIPVQISPEPEPPEPEQPNPSPEPMPPIPTPIPEENKPSGPSVEVHIEEPTIQSAESSINIPADVTEPKEPVTPAVVQPTPTVSPPTASTPPVLPQDNKLNSILDSLQSKSENNVSSNPTPPTIVTPFAPPVPAPPAPAAMPQIPEPDFH